MSGPYDNGGAGYGYPPQQQGQDYYGQQPQYGQQSGGYGPPAHGKLFPSLTHPPHLPPPNKS